MTEENDVNLNGYPSNLTDEEWEIVNKIINEIEPYKTGRPRKSNLREILNAIYYLNKTGCPWRYLPKDFPDYKLVNYYYNKWIDNGTFEKINTALRKEFRLKKTETPTHQAPSSIARVSKEHQSQQKLAGLMVVS